MDAAKGMFATVARPSASNPCNHLQHKLTRPQLACQQGKCMK